MRKSLTGGLAQLRYSANSPVSPSFLSELKGVTDITGSFVPHAEGVPIFCGHSTKMDFSRVPSGDHHTWTPEGVSTSLYNLPW